jgi:hypothetical protein
MRLYSLILIAIGHIASLAYAAQPQPSDSLIPPKVWSKLDDANKKECASIAYRKLKELNRSYVYTDSSSKRETLKDIWVADTNFRLPNTYIVRVNYGSGWLTNVPGIQVRLQAEIPSFLPASVNTGSEQLIQMQLTCRSPGSSQAMQSAQRQALDENFKFTHVLPNIGLTGKSYSDSGTSTASYTPTDSNVRNFNGMPLKIVCDRRYPFENQRQQRAQSLCSSSFMFNDKVSVGYSFPIYQLPHWDTINKGVIKFLQAHVVGNYGQ